jgi:hypothetical protein
MSRRLFEGVVAKDTTRHSLYSERNLRFSHDVPIVRLVLYTTKESQAHLRTMSIELATATKGVSQSEIFDELDEK